MCLQIEGDALSCHVQASSTAIMRPEQSKHLFHAILQVGHAAMKLMGRHPAEVMVGELKPKHSKKPSWKPLQSIVWGARAIEQPAGPNGTLSCEQQADCLLRQASDPFLLFCSFAGWKPWL